MMRDASSVMREVSCAMRDGSRMTEDVSRITWGMVGERSVIEGSATGRTRGRHGSEDAGISSEKTGENPVRRKPKGS